MYEQLSIGLILLAITTLVHGSAIAIAAFALRPFTQNIFAPLRFIRDILALVIIALWLLGAHLLEIWIWGYAYVRLDILADLETAIYFSSVCYTTLGLGGIEISQDWHLLPGMNAANGFLLFGMSAAFMMDIKNKMGLNR